MADTDGIRLMVVDDHPVLRNGISFSMMAFDDIKVVGEAGNGADAVRLCDELRPDVVLMDMVMPGLDGAEATRAIRRHNPETQVLILSSFSETALVRGALQAGAIGYLLKDIALDELAHAIRSASASRSTLAHQATEALVADSDTELWGIEALTERQREVLALVIDGKSNQEIARLLFISLPTVRFHVSTILGKLGASNRAQAAALAVKNQLVVGGHAGHFSGG